MNKIFDSHRERKAGVVLTLGICSFITGYFSLQLTLGNAPIFDPRDILVTCAGALAGPAGGGIAGFLAGAGGPEPSIHVPLYTLGGIFTGLIARYLVAGRKWVPGAVLGLGACYPLAGLLMMVSGYSNKIAALAFQSLIMQFCCILILSILQSLDPLIFSWDGDTGEGSPETGVL